MEECNIMLNIEDHIKTATTAIDAAKSINDLEKVRVEYLGKKGKLTQELKNLKDLSDEERPKFGKIVNDAKNKLTNAIEEKRKDLNKIEVLEKLKQEEIDVTLSGRNPDVGKLHPITKTFQRMENYFSQLGFEIAYGPEIEDVYHNLKP